MERDFTWNKPFARKCDLDKGNAVEAKLIGVCDPPLWDSDTHVVRIGNCLRTYKPNGQYYESGPSELDLVNLPEKQEVGDV